MRSECNDSVQSLNSSIFLELLQFLVLARLGDLDELHDVVNLFGVDERVGDPVKERARRDDSQDHVPAPEKSEHFLVDDVDEQGALDGVTIQVGQVANFEVAESHSREMARFGPRTARPDITENLETEEQELAAFEASVQDEELRDDVDGVEELGEAVGDGNALSGEQPRELDTGDPASGSDAAVR